METDSELVLEDLNLILLIQDQFQTAWHPDTSHKLMEKTALASFSTPIISKHDFHLQPSQSFQQTSFFLGHGTCKFQL